MKLMISHSLIDYEITPKEIFKSSFNEFDEFNTPVAFIQEGQRPSSFLELESDEWSASKDFQIIKKNNVMFMIRKRDGMDIYEPDLREDDDVVAVKSSKLDLNFTTLDSTLSQLQIPKNYTVLHPSVDNLYSS